MTRRNQALIVALVAMTCPLTATGTEEKAERWVLDYEVFHYVIEDCYLRTENHASAVRKLGASRAERFTRKFVNDSPDVRIIANHMIYKVRDMLKAERLAFYEIARDWCFDEFKSPPERKTIFGD